MKKIINVIALIVFIFSYLFFNQLTILAATSPWAQTNWSGGSGQSAWSDSTKYSSGSTVITSTANQVTLSLEQFTNPDFETNLDNWNAGVNPEDITGMKLWLKADSITGLSSGDFVSSWTDSSGNDNNALQATDSRRPTYITNVLNGKPVIRFNGTTQGMYVPDTTELDATSGFSIFVVTTAGKSGADQVIVYKGDLDSGNNYNYRIIHWPDGQKYGGLGSLSGEIYYAFGATNVGTPEILSSYWNGTQLKAFVNGTQAGSAGANVTGKAYRRDFQIGYDNVSNIDFFQGDIAEIIVYNSIITDANRQQVEAYLQAKYGISSGYGTVTRDTATTYNGSAGSAKLVVGANATDFIQSVNVGNTDTYNLVGYAYTDGSALTSSDVELLYNGSTIATTFTSVGSGWYKLSGTLTGANTARDYGVRVKANKTVYLDNMSLRNAGTVTGTITSSIFDSEFDDGAVWETLTYSATTPTSTTATVKVRTGNESDLSDATAFSSCSSISSASTASSNACVTNGNQYAQYQITLSTTDSTATPTFTGFSLAFSDNAQPSPTPTPTPSPTSQPESSSGNNSSSPSCSAQTPSGAPDLFQISTSPTTATLYFTSVNPATGYIISYGLNSQANQYSTSFDYTNGNGAVSYTIGNLDSGTIYYFKVQAQNNCAVGAWSQTISEISTGSITTPSNPPSPSPTQSPSPRGEIIITNSEQKEVLQTDSPSKDSVGEGYNVEILVQKNGKPVGGAIVEMHSTPRRTTTDKDGIARFSNVESGNHIVYLSYDGYKGEQKITLDSEKKQVMINFTIELKPYSSWVVHSAAGFIIILLGIILFLLFFIFKRRKKEQSTKIVHSFYPLTS